jgi:hypothetical protein
LLPLTFPQVHSPVFFRILLLLCVLPHPMLFTAMCLNPLHHRAISIGISLLPITAHIHVSLYSIRIYQR